MNLYERFGPSREASTPKRPVLRFEEGYHSVSSKKETDRLLTLIQKSGDTRLHVWNSAVATRVRTYSPDFIGIDSLLPSLPNQNPLEAKKSVWASLPDTPSRLNGRREIYVISGDSNLGIEEKIWDSDIFHLLEIGAFIAAGGVIGDVSEDIIHAAQYWYAYANRLRDGFEDPTLPEVSRRIFLGAIGMFLGFTLHQAPNLTSLISWPALQEEGRSITNIFEPAFIVSRHDDVIMDGRTALVIEKMDNVLKAFPGKFDKKAVGSILMGTAHTFHSNRLLADTDLRHRYIRSYAQSLIKIAREELDSEHYSGPAVDINIVTGGLINYLRTIDVYRVNNPDEKRFKDNPEKEIGRVVEKVGTYESPGVTEALKNLLPTF